MIYFLGSSILLILGLVMAAEGDTAKAAIEGALSMILLGFAIYGRE